MAADNAIAPGATAAKVTAISSPLRGLFANTTCNVSQKVLALIFLFVEPVTELAREKITALRSPSPVAMIFLCNF